VRQRARHYSLRTEGAYGAGAVGPSSRADVRICRALWQETKPGEPPRSLAALINGLKGHAILPSHQANIMLTVCDLRNVHVYEGLELQTREMAVAVNATAIITDWWARQSGEKR